MCSACMSAHLHLVDTFDSTCKNVSDAFVRLCQRLQSLAAVSLPPLPFSIRLDASEKWAASSAAEQKKGPIHSLPSHWTSGAFVESRRTMCITRLTSDVTRGPGACVCVRHRSIVRSPSTPPKKVTAKERRPFLFTAARVLFRLNRMIAVGRNSSSN